MESRLLTNRRHPIGGGLLFQEANERFFFLLSLPGYGDRPSTVSTMPNGFLPVFEQAAMLARLLGCDRYVAMAMNLALGTAQTGFLGYHPGHNPVLDSLTLSIDCEGRRKYMHAVHAEEVIETTVRPDA